MIFWSIKGKPVFGSKMIMFGTPHAANIDVGSLVDHGVSLVAGMSFGKTRHGLLSQDHRVDSPTSRNLKPT